MTDYCVLCGEETDEICIDCGDPICEICSYDGRCDKCACED